MGFFCKVVQASAKVIKRALADANI